MFRGGRDLGGRQHRAARGKRQRLEKYLGAELRSVPGGPVAEPVRAASLSEGLFQVGTGDHVGFIPKPSTSIISTLVSLSTFIKHPLPSMNVVPLLQNIPGSRCQFVFWNL